MTGVQKDKLYILVCPFMDPIYAPTRHLRLKETLEQIEKVQSLLVQADYPNRDLHYLKGECNLIVFIISQTKLT
ncbi:hypothetical protein GCM10025767_03480 [Thalassotalea piscium]